MSITGRYITMRGGNIIGTPPVIIPLDPDAIAFLTAAAITDPTITSAINTLVVDLKGYGIWTKMKALYPFVGGTASTHKFNLINPLDTNDAFRLTFFGGLTHNTNGITGNGTNGYFNTNLNDQQNLPLNNFSVFAYSTNNIQRDADVFFSTLDSVNNAIVINPRNTANNFAVRAHSVNIGSIGNNDSRGFFGMNRSNNTNVNMVKNNVSTQISLVSSGTQNSNLFGLYFPTILIYSLRNIAFASIGLSLTTSESSNLYTAVQTFQTTLSRQV